MKKIFIFALSVVIISNIIAQNTLDNIGLTAGTPAALAYSFRKLSSTYSGNAIQVRRSSDNTTQNIGFSGNELDTAALKTFVGSGNGYISIWYDQSGNSTNLSQGSAGNQPRIVNAGVIDRENGKPFVRFFGVVSGIYNSLNLPVQATTTAQIIVVNKFTSGGAGFILGHTGAYKWHANYSNSKLIDATHASATIRNASVFQNARSIAPLSAVWNTTLMINSIAPSTPGTETNWDNIGTDRFGSHNTTAGGGYAELIIFTSAISSGVRLNVEINQGSYYGIPLAGNLNKNGKITIVTSEYVNRNGAIGGSALYATGESVTNQLPVLASTTAATSISSVSAVSGGNLTSDGGGSAPLTVGICWNTSTSPTIANSKTAATGTTGNFTASLTSLAGSTTYYVRAYATNSVGTVYGNEISFTTLAPVLPTLAATTALSEIMGTTAVSGGNVTGNGGAALTARGVCWSTSSAPTISDSKTIDGTVLGGFSSYITCLTSATTYYVRAYATNSVGTAYGSEISFTTITLNIGDSLQGGIIAYILQNGDSGYDACIQHGLIAAHYDQSTSAKWGCASTLIPGSFGTEIGTGYQNTENIIYECYEWETAAESAMYYYDPDIGPYYDWYLPSLDELNILYTNRIIIGGFSTGSYWSSSQIDASEAWFQDFSNGSQSNSHKDNTFYVRAVRSF